MNDNYIFIDGKKYLLTEVKEKDNPFWLSKLPNDEFYFYIDDQDRVMKDKELAPFPFDNNRRRIANYFRDEDFAKQIALEQTLRRLLIKYACSCETTPSNNLVYRIRYDRKQKKYEVFAEYLNQLDLFQVYFNTEKDANNAIEEVIKPFMKEHPNFKWR